MDEAVAAAPIVGNIRLHSYGSGCVGVVRIVIVAFSRAAPFARLLWVKKGAPQDLSVLYSSEIVVSFVNQGVGNS